MKHVLKVFFSDLPIFDICRGRKTVLNITICYLYYCQFARNKGTTVARKGLSAWLFSSLTFVAIMHWLDAASALIFNNPIRLLPLYPFIGQKLQSLTPFVYFCISAIISVVLWGITCRIVFENPVEAFLRQILAETKVNSSVETQLIDRKSEVLDAMYETIEASSDTLLQLKDLVCNVRTEAREIQPLRDSVESMKADMGNLKKEIRRIMDNGPLSNSCHTCGRPLLPEFIVCPYCGESARSIDTPVLTLKNLR